MPAGCPAKRAWLACPALHLAVVRGVVWEEAQAQIGLTDDFPAAELKGSGRGGQLG